MIEGERILRKVVGLGAVASLALLSPAHVDSANPELLDILHFDPPRADVTGNLRALNTNSSREVKKSSEPCRDDGKSGQRVQAVHHGSDEQYLSAVDQIKTVVYQIDEIITRSGWRQGVEGEHVRWVTTNCEPVVLHLNDPNPSDNALVNFAKARSLYTPEANRLFLVFTENSLEGNCGMAEVVYNDDPSENNYANKGNRVSLLAGKVLKPFCWTAQNAAHEFLHNIGAVQPGAPGGTSRFHCIDLYDLMCYFDGSPEIQKMIYSCLELRAEFLLGCRKESYFDLKPQPGSYSATHWTADKSKFLSREAWDGLLQYLVRDQLFMPVGRN